MSETNVTMVGSEQPHPIGDPGDLICTGGGDAFVIPARWVPAIQAALNRAVDRGDLTADRARPEGAVRVRALKRVDAKGGVHYTIPNGDAGQLFSGEPVDILIPARGSDGQYE